MSTAEEFTNGLQQIEQHYHEHLREVALLHNGPATLSQYVALIHNSCGVPLLHRLRELPKDLEDEVVALFRRIYG